MTEPRSAPGPASAGSPLPPPGEGRNGRRGRWLRLALVVSLALNLAVAGIVGGALLGRTSEAPREAQLSRELGLGPFLGALDDHDRAELRAAAKARRGELRSGRAEWKQAFEESLQVLRSEPFDADRLRALVERQAQLAGAARGIGQDLLIAQLARMDQAERAAFADRIEQDLRKGPGHDGAGGPGAPPEHGRGTPPPPYH